MKVKLKNNFGFTLIELIVVVAILMVLIALLIPNIVGYINNANRMAVQQNARQVYNAAQTSLINIKANKPDSLNSASNSSDFKVLTNTVVTENDLNSSDSSDFDKMLAVEISNVMGWKPGAENYPFNNAAQPYGRSAKDYQQQSNQPGFVLQYYTNGVVNYMEWCDRGYLVRIKNSGGEIEIIEDGTFSNESDLTN